VKRSTPVTDRRAIKRLPWKVVAEQSLSHLGRIVDLIALGLWPGAFRGARVDPAREAVKERRSPIAE
jgi:hypothetical protein